jgi:hypothetical protein
VSEHELPEPYRPPWYPYQDNPWTIVSNTSNNIVTKYSRWCAGLAPGELKRLIAAHRAEAQDKER